MLRKNDTQRNKHNSNILSITRNVESVSSYFSDLYSNECYENILRVLSLDKIRHLYDGVHAPCAQHWIALSHSVVQSNCLTHS